MLLSSIKCDGPTFEDDYFGLSTGRKGYVNLGKNKVLVMEGWWRVWLGY